MAATSGRKLRIKYNGAVIAGAKSDTFSVANEPIDITDKDDLGVQTLLDDIGKQSFSMSVEGVAKDAILEGLAMSAGEGAAVHQFIIDVVGARTITGSWFISSYESTGADGEATTFSCSLTSSGPMVVAVVP